MRLSAVVILYAVEITQRKGKRAWQVGRIGNYRWMDDWHSEDDVDASNDKGRESA